MSLTFDPLLIEFWKSKTEKQLKTYAEPGGDGCNIASDDFVDFLKNKKINSNVKKIKVGVYKNKKKQDGWIKVDVAQTKLEDLTDDEVDKMVAQGLKPYLKKDVAKFIKENNLTEELKWIPHSWVSINGKIFDPSGFYEDGSGQFDKLVKDKNKNNNELAKRYMVY